jgi:predicted deacylase
MQKLTNIQKALFLFWIVLFGIAIGWVINRHYQAIEPMLIPTQPEPAVEQEVIATSTQTQIGSSVEGRAIEAFTFGTGETDLLFVGGVHGGYEANSVRLAEGMIEEFQLKPELVPSNVTVHIIPVLNPDGYARALSTDTTYTDSQKRFNANDVDLNRNFGCKWAPTSSWRGQSVSAGTAAFSEPEAQALRQYVRDTTPAAAIFWHSVANNVYGSECENGILPATLTLMNTYGDAASYGKVPIFDAYPITGDAEGWLASIGIPAVTVELETRDSIEWTRNIAGMKAVLELYRK